MMISIYRYRTSKPKDGHFFFELHGGASVLHFTEQWHSEKGWEVWIDALSNAEMPLERRYFFLCTQGDNVAPLGEDAALYHLFTHESKGYSSFLFETTHLSETERLALKSTRIMPRRPPTRDEMGRQQRLAIDRLAEQRRNGLAETPPGSERVGFDAGIEVGGTTHQVEP